MEHSDGTHADEGQFDRGQFDRDHHDDDVGERLPGLFRAWELGLILRPGTDYRIEAAGETRDGGPLMAVYRRAGLADRGTDRGDWHSADGADDESSGQ